MAYRRIGLLLFLPVLVTCDSGVTGLKNTRIGEEGGTAILAGGSVALSIPAGAVAAEIELAATEASSFPPSDLVVPGSTFDVSPSETTFARLVGMTLSYDPGKLPEGVREEELRLFKAEGGQWKLVLHASVDTQANTVSGMVSSLGQFAARGVSVAMVDVTPSYYTLEQGRTKGFTAVGRDASGLSLPERALTWTSSDEGVATVDANGLVTALGVGSATVTAAAEGKTASAQISTWDCSSQSEIPEAECQALIDLFNTANVVDWHYSPSWIPSPDPCDWLGVTCEGGSVTEVDLHFKELAGSVPHSIAQLTNLKRLDLSGNQINGMIPASLGDLSNLRHLELRGNQLSGPIPSELQELSNLSVLNLGQNELTGPIPPGLGSLSGLTDLTLGWNQLSGPIPSELGDLSNLTYLGLIDNQLSGSIPPELGDLSALEGLSLGVNQLSGQIPQELGKLSKLVSLGMSRNQLSGAIPAELGDLAVLNGFYLWDNALSGLVPLGVAQLGGQIQARSGGASNCSFFPPGNEGLSMPDTQEYHDADQNGDGKICGVGIGAGTWPL